jgi:hypothetical protein
VTDLSKYVLLTLREDGEFVLSRGRREGIGPPPGGGPRVGTARAGEPHAARARVCAPGRAGSRLGGSAPGAGAAPRAADAPE